jgi:hypothetical protein
LVWEAGDNDFAMLTRRGAWKRSRVQSQHINVVECF